MEWLIVVAALACPIGMLAMGALAWAVGKRAGRSNGAEGSAMAPNSAPREGAPGHG
jgi:hypothetical protein